MPEMEKTPTALFWLALTLGTFAARIPLQGLRFNGNWKSGHFILEAEIFVRQHNAWKIFWLDGSEKSSEIYSRLTVPA